MATDKGPWSSAARAKRKATLEAKAKGLGPVTSVPINDNEPKPAKRPYTKKQTKVTTAKVNRHYDKATIRECIARLMEML